MATRFSETSGGAIMVADGDKRGPRVYLTSSDAMPVPGMGWFATCTDSEGNDFGLWQHDPSASAPAS